MLPIGNAEAPIVHHAASSGNRRACRLVPCLHVGMRPCGMREGVRARYGLQPPRRIQSKSCCWAARSASGVGTWSLKTAYRS